MLRAAVVVHHPLLPVKLAFGAEFAPPLPIAAASHQLLLAALQRGGEALLDAVAAHGGGGVDTQPGFFFGQPHFGPGVGIFAAHLPEATVGVVFAALIAGDHAGGYAGGAHDGHKAFGVVFAEAAAVVEHEVVDAVGAAVERGVEGVGEGLVAVVG